MCEHIQVRLNQEFVVIPISVSKSCFFHQGLPERMDVAAEHFAHNEDSDAQVNTARDLEFAINEHETAELATIDAALTRLSAGSYGHCIDCFATIPEARQNAAPEAARCIGCQEKTEHNHH